MRHRGGRDRVLGNRQVGQWQPLRTRDVHRTIAGRPSIETTQWVVMPLQPGT